MDMPALSVGIDHIVEVQQNACRAGSGSEHGRPGLRVCAGPSWRVKAWDRRRWKLGLFVAAAGGEDDGLLGRFGRHW